MRLTTKKNPISEKTAHKLRKASPRTFEKMTDEEIKRAFKVKKKRVKKNPVRALKKKQKAFIELAKHSVSGAYAVILHEPRKLPVLLTAFDNKQEAKNHGKTMAAKWKIDFLDL
jgi:hypothetical protein